MTAPADPSTKPRWKGARRMRGFEPASGLLRDHIRKAGETHGFATTRLLTHWAEVAGPDLAALCTPVKVSYAQKGFGATLTVLASGAAAPLVQMQLDPLRDRVNAIYGYAAIARIKVTQTSSRGLANGLAESQRGFERPNLAQPSPQALARARSVVDSLTEGVADSGLKAALDRMATNILTKETPPAKETAPGPKVPAGERKDNG